MSEVTVRDQRLERRTVAALLRQYCPADLDAAMCTYLVARVLEEAPQGGSLAPVLQPWLAEYDLSPADIGDLAAKLERFLIHREAVHVEQSDIHDDGAGIDEADAGGDRQQTAWESLLQATLRAWGSQGPVANPFLSPLENPVPMGEMAWLGVAGGATGQSGGMLVDTVTGRFMQAAKERVSLAWTAAQTTSASGHAGVSSAALSKAEQKLAAKQAKREQRRKAAGEVRATSLFEPSTAMPTMEELLAGAGAGKSRDIKLDRFDVHIPGKRILTDAALSLPYGRRVGLVGRNGVGKSTLLKAISSRALAVPKHVSILHVEQEVIGDDTPALQSVLASDALREALLQRERDCGRRTGPDVPDGPDKELAMLELQRVYARLEEIESDKAESRASTILAGLGFTPAMQVAATKTFSGGWRMRLALARALFCRPDLLLLDEPTNMLDLPAVVWLQHYLSPGARLWSGSILCVSHDRDFLDAICTDMLHLHHESLDTYRGNYAAFLSTKEERRKAHERDYEANVAYRAHLQAFVDRWRYNAARAALAQSKIKILEKLPVLQPYPVDPPITFAFPPVEPLHPPIVHLDNVAFGYAPPPAPPLLAHIDFSLQGGSRVAIVGPNGAGKSTFLKLMTGSLQPSSGFVSISGRCRFGFFSQHHVDALADPASGGLDAPALAYLIAKHPDKTEEELRKVAGAFGLSGSLALQPIYTLSGGQKSRLMFASLAALAPHVLILDEPTNHLDVDSVDALIACLNAFPGVTVLVSHDARFVEAVATELWLVDHHRVQKYPGSIRDYMSSLDIPLA